MNKRKKVKFWDHESARTRRIRSPVAGDAKTSEYKSFQNLLGKSHTNQPPRYDNDSRNLDANNSMLKRNDPAAAKIHGRRSISPALVVTPIAHRPFSSANTISLEPDLKDNVRCKHTTSSIQSTMPKCIFDPWGSPFSPGPEKKYEEIFSIKRENLLKLAAGTLTCKADDIISNKSNLIQECMQRLSRGQESANPEEISKPREKASCARSHSYASMRSHNKDKETQVLERKRDISLVDQHCNRDDELFSPVPKLQLDSYFDAGESELSTNYNTRLHHIPLKAPTLQSIEYYSDSMLDGGKQHKSSSNRYSRNFRHKRKLEEQQIIPYGNSDIAYNLYDHDISPKFRKEQDCDFSLLEYCHYTNAKPEDSEELDHSLPLALYNDHDNTLDQAENIEPVDFFGEEDMFRSLPIGKCSEYEFDDEESDYGSSWCATRNKYDDSPKKNEMKEIERYLSPDFSSCYNFSMDRETSFLNFLPAPETNLFEFLSYPERFSWR